MFPTGCRRWDDDGGDHLFMGASHDDADELEREENATEK
jgi:hypothetical protein